MKSVISDSGNSISLCFLPRYRQYKWNYAQVQASPGMHSNNHFCGTPWTSHRTLAGRQLIHDSACEVGNILHGTLPDTVCWQNWFLLFRQNWNSHVGYICGGRCCWFEQREKCKGSYAIHRGTISCSPLTWKRMIILFYSEQSLVDYNHWKYSTCVTKNWRKIF